MKKTFLLLLILISISFVSFSQTTADRNFTGTDLNGNTYDLYDLLGQGKYVLMWYGYVG